MLQGLAIPEEYGGQGFTFIELGIVLEEMGRVLLCAPVLLVGRARGERDPRTPAPTTQKQALLPGHRDAATRSRRSRSPSRRASGTRPASRWRRRRRGGEFTLSGEKMFVIDGHAPTSIVVVARTAGTTGTDGISFFTVARRRRGPDPHARSQTMDMTRKQAKLEFDNVVGRRRSAARGTAAPRSPRRSTRPRSRSSNEMMGGAQKVLEMSVEYAKVRVQFGRPIGSFQAIKHKCADMLLEVESGKSAAYYASWAAAEDNDELPVVAALSKAYCSEAYFHATAENIQIHGGIGFTWEHPAHLYFKRAKSSEIYLGDPTYHRELLAQRIGI